MIKENPEPMDKPMSNFSFRMMSLLFRLRDLYFNPVIWLGEAGITEGMKIVDYGCGPGTYTLAAARIVKETGKVYAIDIQPLAHKIIIRKAKKLELGNIIPLLPKDKINLPDVSIDLVLLYDVFHSFSQKKTILEEIFRILKPYGKISFSDHHMKESDIMESFEKQGQFTLAGKELYTYNFIKN